MNTALPPGYDYMDFIAIDDCSEPGSIGPILTKHLANAKPHWAGKWILRTFNQQLFTRASNLGIRMAMTLNPQYVALVNSDCALEPDWLAAAVDIMDRNPTIGLAGYRDGTPPLPTDFTEVNDQGFITGHCVVFRSKALEQVGLFLESDLGIGWEGYVSQGARPPVYPQYLYCKGTAHIGSDHDMSLRLRQSGWRTVYVDRPFVSHEAGKSWGHNLSWLQQFNLILDWPVNDSIASLSPTFYKRFVDNALKHTHQ